MKKLVKVALNMSRMSVPQRINKARLIADAILSNPVPFASPNPSIVTVQSATDDLEAAWNAAADGGKIKTSIMHDKENTLMQLLTQLAYYVEGVANNDEEVVHLSGFSIRRDATRSNADLEVVQAADRGAVRLRVKPAAKVAYRWEYCKDPMGVNAWVVAKVTTQSTTNWGDLDEGARYWFRVVYLSNDGSENIPFSPVSIIVL